MKKLIFILSLFVAFAATSQTPPKDRALNALMDTILKMPYVDNTHTDTTKLIKIAVVKGQSIDSAFLMAIYQVQHGTRTGLYQYEYDSISYCTITGESIDLYEFYTHEELFLQLAPK